MNISEHFTLKELTASQTATRHKIDEQFEPSLLVKENLKYVSEKLLEPIREKIGAFKVSSGYRSPKLNKLVKGSKNSFHLSGCAVDIDRGSIAKNKELHDWIKDNLDYTELINEYNFSWVHVAIVKGREKEKVNKIII